MIQIDGFIFLLLLISVAALCYGAGKIGFKNLWGFDDDKSNSNVIKFIGGRYVKPNRKAQ
ncbi:hypothetical protein [Latilactobacillus sakei]|uniref:Uncharacterized protein n=1 Tax=Latilactobacillus sakei TaxID=1599 RepID=A0AAX0V9U8_LATSK|nr:hypothetical protein [Latilactobacillus sakei]KGB13873.1 hypothetical protein KY41_10775 [Latilactobacillus sakei]PKX71422.1 hypothetical protein CUR35_07505 [Latilactobacillus sakei]PKX77252.1 hypothetical protein CUR37_07240 [Latilactobacillus sakei]USG05847.1 hypothetical protein A4W88_04075 [Latilactobacillus sakei]